jgi:hypothetical protein
LFTQYLYIQRLSGYDYIDILYILEEKLDVLSLTYTYTVYNKVNLECNNF